MSETSSDLSINSLIQLYPFCNSSIRQSTTFYHRYLLKRVKQNRPRTTAKGEIVSCRVVYTQPTYHFPDSLFFSFVTCLLFAINNSLPLLRLDGICRVFVLSQHGCQIATHVYFSMTVVVPRSAYKDAPLGGRYLCLVTGLHALSSALLLEMGCVGVVDISCTFVMILHVLCVLSLYMS